MAKYKDSFFSSILSSERFRFHALSLKNTSHYPKNLSFLAAQKLQNLGGWR